MCLAVASFGGNPTEVQIMLACAERPVSARDLTPPGESVSRTSYHFNQLRKHGLIRQNRTVQVRGAVKKIHTLTPKGRKLLKRLGLLDGGVTLAEAEAEVQRRAKAMKAAPYEPPSDEDWAIYSEGTGLELEDVVEAGYGYADKWMGDGPPMRNIVAGGYICGIMVGHVRQIYRASS